MDIAAFETEHFFAEYEFTTPHLLCVSDCETLSVAELLELAGVPLEELGRLRLSYTESEGNPALRRAIADGYRTVSPKDILVLGTPIEGIYIAARALLEPGDEVIVPAPAYDALIHVFEHVAGPGAVRRWEIAPTEDGWELDTDQLARLITEKTRLLVVNFPHNPTGLLPSAEQQRGILELARDHGVAVFYDEMYFGLVHPPTEPIPSTADVDQSAVVLSGLSKSYGLPGLRTGWLVVRDPALRRRFLNWKFYTSICPPAPSEFLATVALGIGKRLVARSLAQIHRNLDSAEAFFGRWPELFEWRRPMAGSVALVGLNVDSVPDFSRRLVDEAGVLIQPASMLAARDRFVRMGFGRAGFAAGLEALEAWLRASYRN